MIRYLAICVGLLGLFAALAVQAEELAKPAPSPPEQQETEKQYYKYAHNDAEYSVMLPEAPSVETIWGEDGDVPYLKDPPKEGALGEVATFRRVDIKTQDFFDVKITFLRAPSDFLAELTEADIKAVLERDFAGERLSNKKFTSSGTENALKWISISGFSLDQNKHPLYNAEHYLTGEQSILVVKVRFSVENQGFADDYKMMVDNITYHAL